jgi:rod shape determining protein RodA
MTTIAASDKRLANLHWPLVLSTALICGLGVWNLASASRGALQHVWQLQMMWMLIGCVTVAVFLFVDYRWLSTLAWPGYFLALGLLTAVAFRGKKVLGARRWLQIGRFQIQPSELVKIALIVLLARFFARDEEGARKGDYGLRQLWKPFLLVLVPVGLIMKQPDLGTALMAFAIAMTMVLFAKVRLKSLAVLIIGGALATTVAWKYGLKDYQKQRVYTFLNPEAFAKSSGYHAIQSVIAVGSGQVSGKGWGEGTQNALSFLPEQHTDFIFSVWAEEHGFLGCFGLIFLYGFLILTALDVAANARDKFGAFLCIGVASLFFWHAFVNIGMVTGILPVVGVPLPLFSSGGTSVVVNLVSVGILLNVSLRRFMF